MEDPARETPVLDLDHLDRQTFGDADLRRELLDLYLEQCARLRPLVTEGPRAAALEAAHTLRGASSAIGAFRVAAALCALEAAAPGADGAPPAALAQVLREAAADVDRTIRQVLEGSAAPPRQA
jgi:HPt (histidine-containing phosphotransfer) domain-containing protein